MPTWCTFTAGCACNASGLVAPRAYAPVTSRSCRRAVIEHYPLTCELLESLPLDDSFGPNQSTSALGRPRPVVDAPAMSGPSKEPTFIIGRLQWNALLAPRLPSLRGTRACASSSSTGSGQVRVFELLHGFRSCKARGLFCRCSQIWRRCDQSTSLGEIDVPALASRERPRRVAPPRQGCA